MGQGREVANHQVICIKVSLPRPIEIDWVGFVEVAGHRAGELKRRKANNMEHIVVKLPALIALACSLATTARAESFAKRVDIGGGRMIYIECHGSGSPTVLLISGTDTASDLWHAAGQKGPTVYDDIQKTTRVCAYDRPGAPHLDQTFSRSDPVTQPTRPAFSKFESYQAALSSL
jgi:hypothetical protein